MNNKNALKIYESDDLQYKSYIVFCLNSNKYAVDIQNILEVINIPKIDMPVSPPKGIIGMFDYNGIMIKAVDLCPLIDMPSKPFSINNQLIVIIVNSNCFALHTEYIENIIRINQNELQPFPFSTGFSIIKSVYKDGENIINVVEADRIEAAAELNKSVKSEIDYRLLLPNDEKSLQTLLLRGNLLKKNDETFSFPFNLNTINQYIMFTLGRHNYYLDLKYVKEFVSINAENITPLPYTKSFIKGLLNIRGEFLAALDLKNFLNNEFSDEKEILRIIVAEGKTFNIALIVDEIKYIKNLKQFQTEVHDKTCSKYILSEFEEENELYSIINFEKIMNDEDLFINIC